MDDARSWFASTKEKFDLVQMSMIDTWAATGAGAFSLSENGLYTLEGWRAFLATINNKGFFTVSRWYNPGDANETGRMTGLAAAALLDAGIDDIRAHLFVARADHIATLILSKTAFTADELLTLRTSVANLGFEVLLAPDEPSDSAPALLRAITEARDIATLDRLGGSTYLDLTVPTDNRPFFFNQLRLTSIPDAASRLLTQTIRGGVLVGNLIASTTLLLILFISIVAVIATIVVPLRGAVRECHPPLIVAGSLYFSLIGVGFMFTEISLLQSFSVYLGHPIYALGICLFSLILSSGLGSLASDRIRLDTRGKLAGWGMIVALYLFVLERTLPAVFQATTDQDRLVRISIAVITIIPLGLLLGFAFPTGMRLVEAVDRRPTPWFWGINGATGVLASVLAVMCSMTLGIGMTMVVSGLCYLLLVPTGLALVGLSGRHATSVSPQRVTD